MNVMRLAVTTALLVLSFQAAAADAGRCAETRRNIARLEDNLRKAATDSDRLAYQQSLSAYRMAEPGICGTGPSASGPRATPPGANSPAANAAALLGPVLGALQSVPLDAAAYMPARTGPTLPSPPTPSGSVTGPMTLQRLGGPSVSTATVNTPRVHTLEPSVPSPFPTDQQLRARCSRSGNPDFCLLDLQTQRDRDPAYLRWKAQESARMDRNIDASLANVHATVAAQSARNAGPTIAVPVIAAARPTIPVAPPPMPYDNSDPDLARCREGARTPETIAGCYDLGRGPSARQAAPRPSLRDRLKKALDALPDTIALPFRDTAPAESEYDTRWQPAAEAQLR